MEIKSMLFDLGGTLCFPVTGHWLVPLKAVELIGNKNLNIFYTEHAKAAFFECSRILNDNQLLSTEEEEFDQFKIYYNNLFEYFPELNLSKKQIEQIAYDKVFNTMNFGFYDDAYSSVKELFEKYETGVLSDTWPSTTSALKRVGLYSLFDHITYSCEIGVCKPNKKMYAAAISKSNAAAQNIVFIDDLKKNLDGAKESGLQPVLIRNGSPYDDLCPYKQIDKVSEIRQLLGKL